MSSSYLYLGRKRIPQQTRLNLRAPASASAVWVAASRPCLCPGTTSGKSRESRVAAKLKNRGREGECRPVTCGSGVDSCGRYRPDSGKRDETHSGVGVRGIWRCPNDWPTQNTCGPCQRLAGWQLPSTTVDNLLPKLERLYPTTVLPYVRYQLEGQPREGCDAPRPHRVCHTALTARQGGRRRAQHLPSGIRQQRWARFRADFPRRPGRRAGRRGHDQGLDEVQPRPRLHHVRSTPIFFPRARAQLADDFAESGSFTLATPCSPT